MSDASGLPSDWRQREDWMELLIQQVLNPTTEEHALALVEIGEELSHAGASQISMMISAALALTELGESLSSFSADQLLSDISFWRQLMDRLGSDGPRTAVTAALLRLAANSIRGVVEENDDAITTSALAWYSTAATVFRSMGEIYDAAIARQSESATRFLMGDVTGAERIARSILPTFKRLGAWHNEVGVRLNLVQYALEVGNITLARRRLGSVEPLLFGPGSGHFRTSFLALTGLVEVRRGRFVEAHSHFVRALSSARRREDTPQQLQLLQDLAALSIDREDARAALRWLRLGVATASNSLNRRAEQAFLRSLGATLVGAERYSEARSAFLAAASINDDLQLPRAAAQSRADAAGVLTARAIRAFGRVSDAPSKRHRFPTRGEIDEAEAALLAAFEELLRLGDLEWLERVGRNLDTLWLVNGRSRVAADFFRTAGDRLADVDPAIAANFFEMAVQMGIVARQEQAWLVETSVEGAEHEAASLPDDPTAWAWYLARLATRAGEVSHEWELALELYSLAKLRLRELNDVEAYAHVQNDAALASTELGNVDDARSRFREVRDIASEEENRVLGALALTNLGELELHNDRFDVALAMLREGAELSVEIGDLEQAAGAWASVSQAIFTSSEDIPAARSANDEAARLARASGSTSVQARVVSNFASLASLEDDAREARRLWRRAERTHPEKGLLYRSFILESWAKDQNWPSYNRALRSYITEAQATNESLRAARNLGRAVATLLRLDQPRRAADTGAVALLLATDGISRRRGRDRSREDLLREDRLWVDFLSVFAAIELIVRDTNLPTARRAIFDRRLASEFRRNAGDRGMTVFRRAFALALDSIDGDNSDEAE